VLDGSSSHLLHVRLVGSRGRDGVHKATVGVHCNVGFQVADLLHGKEEQVWGDSGYRGAQSRVDREDMQWHIAARPSDIAKMPEGRAKRRLQKQEHRKASVRAKVEHPFRVIKRQFGLVKVRFRGLAKNTAHLVTLFALSNLWMARKQLMAMTGVVRPKAA
jgi:IS5 family transposase